jgi:hypothetical protein
LRLGERKPKQKCAPARKKEKSAINMIWLLLPTPVSDMPMGNDCCKWFAIRTSCLPRICSFSFSSSFMGGVATNVITKTWMWEIFCAESHTEHHSFSFMGVGGRSFLFTFFRSFLRVLVRGSRGVSLVLQPASLVARHSASPTFGIPSVLELLVDQFENSSSSRVVAVFVSITCLQLDCGFR